MFEIGNSLREARLRQGLELPEIEQATKIRGRYLRALEEEQFDVLPAETYVKGFLRTYADYLGLDGQLYVDEYNSRYVTGEDDPPLRRSAVSPRHGRRVESSVVVLALGAIALVTALVIVAWKFGAATQAGTSPTRWRRRRSRAPRQDGRAHRRTAANADADRSEPLLRQGAPGLERPASRSSPGRWKPASSSGSPPSGSGWRPATRRACG